MRQARIFVCDVFAGILTEENKSAYTFQYAEDYDDGTPVSLTMPVRHEAYRFTEFPAFFEGLLPEGVLLDALLLKYKLDRTDYFGQLLKVGKDVVGAVNIEELT